ncbi:MAG: hypothetical protein AAGA46_02960 [Cyanobacteria bacterium P01_F01_bin.13]
MVSLKRTLLSEIASTIEVLNHINHDVSKSNLHSPLRYSAVLLSIGKTTQICHQNIPLKKVHCEGRIIYASAIPRKLEKIWQQPADEIASLFLSVLQAKEMQSVWASVRKNNDGWIEFDISQHGIEQWRQQLTQQIFPLRENIPSWPMEAAQLWQLQSGYELCCRWQACHHQVGISQMESEHLSSAVFRMSFLPLRRLIHCLLSICDGWDEASLPYLLQQTHQLIAALECCASETRPSASEAGDVSRWLASTQIVLKQLLEGRLGNEIAEQF